MQFRQSKDYKASIEKSINYHKVELDRLINEKNNQFNVLKADFDNTISEYQQKRLETASEQTRSFYDEFIEKLKLQKDLINKKVNTYTHSGWNPLDIEVNYGITDNSRFQAFIQLNYVGQVFAIYIRVVTFESRAFWLGLGGNDSLKTFRTKSEYTIHKNFNDIPIAFERNIFEIFKTGFPDNQDKPLYIEKVRIRASHDKIPMSVTFIMT